MLSSLFMYTPKFFDYLETLVRLVLLVFRRLLLCYVFYIFYFFFCFFFFQAEDGIRDATVTGVQTCALPISFAPQWWTRATSGAAPRRSHHGSSTAGSVISSKANFAWCSRRAASVVCCSASPRIWCIPCPSCSPCTAARGSPPGSCAQGCGCTICWPPSTT